MKKILPILLFFCTISLTAQITVTSASFPAIGDTLKTATDGAPQGVIITPPGGNQTWNLSGLQGVTAETVVLPAAEGTNADQFPTADLLFPVGANMEGGDSYANITNQVYELVGYVGPDPANLGINVVVPFSPPIVERRSPMNFFDINTTNSAILLAFPIDSLPDEITNDLPIVPDSIRINFASTRTDIVDAWGTLTIPGGTYEVLRERRTDIRETRLEAKVGIGPFATWVDVTDFLPGDFLGLDTTINYVFINDIEKENIAQITVSNDGEQTPLLVTYKSNDVVTNLSPVNTGYADIFAYPNPAIDKVRINFVNMSPGNYTFRIFNILGKEVMQQQYRINGNRTVGINIDTLQKGTYLYNLSDGRGKIIRTKRLMVIRP